MSDLHNRFAYGLCIGATFGLSWICLSLDTTITFCGILFAGVGVIYDIVPHHTKNLKLTLGFSLWWLSCIYLMYIYLSSMQCFKLTIFLCMSDIIQLIGGRLIPQIRYCPFPKISPNKSLNGYLSSLIILPLFWEYPENISMLSLLLAGFAGDLLASAYKRQVKIKDFSRFLGSHGGLIDRFDTLLVAGPLAVYLQYLGYLYI